MERTGGSDRREEDYDDSPNVFLQACARAGDVEGMISALDGGALLDMKDSWGLAPLHTAVLSGTLEALELLLQQRSSIDLFSGRGLTALHMAAAEGKDDMLQRLLELRADVALQTAFGSTALAIARRRAAAVAAKEAGLSRPSTPSNLPAGTAELAIRKELESRLRSADADEEERRRQLEVAIDSRRRLEAQLGIQRRAASRSPSPSGTTKLEATLLPGQSLEQIRPRTAEVKRPNPSCAYWYTLVDSIENARTKGADAIRRAWMRDLPAQEELDPFPWTGLLATRHCLPVPDPDDDELVGGFEWLKGIKKTAASKLFRQDSFEEEFEGKTQTEWETLVHDLQETGEWDWSKVEVRQRPSPKQAFACAGVFAAGQGTGEVVFNSFDVIGPLGGIIRRRARYEQMYYTDRQWLLHDPACYPLQLKPITQCSCGSTALCVCGRKDTPFGHLELESLVLDMRAGRGHNRLCYLADVRPDPLGLRALLPEVGVKEPDAVPKAILAPRLTMPRPRSRNASPDEPRVFGRTKQTVFVPITPISMQSLKSPWDGDPALSRASPPNAKWVELVVDGWPHVFIIATRTIYSFDEITLDWGEDYWATQRATLTRVLQIGKFGEETESHLDCTVPKTFLNTQQEEQCNFELPQRARMRRVGEDFLT